MTWRMPAMCANCPFHKTGPGYRLRRSLRPSRWQGIIGGLKAGHSFPCHKTTEETGNGTNLVCAGSIDWQHKHGVTSNYERICERLAHKEKQHE